MSELITFVIALLSEGFFSGSEIAIVSSDNGKLLSLAQSGNKNAAEVLKLKENPINFLTVCLIGTNLSAATASFAGTLFILKHFPQYKEIGIFLIIPIMMVFGEIIPKTVYSKFATPISLAISRIIKFLSAALTPFVFLLNKWSNLVSSFLKSEEDLITKEEFDHMLEREKNCLPSHLQVIIDRFKETKNVEYAIFGEKNDK
jgi:CBS domain containing-hemolysin-like protein